MNKKYLTIEVKGGTGSGNWGHRGVPGQRGGSAGGAGGSGGGGSKRKKGKQQTAASSVSAGEKAVTKYLNALDPKNKVISEDMSYGPTKGVILTQQGTSRIEARVVASILGGEGFKVESTQKNSIFMEHPSGASAAITAWPTELSIELTYTP